MWICSDLLGVFIEILFCNQVLFVYNIWEKMFFDNVKGCILYANIDEATQIELLEDLKKSAKRI